MAFLANRLFRITRVPDVVVLTVLGVLIGPLLGVIDGSRFRSITGGVGILAIVLALLEAGLELDLRDTIRQFPQGPQRVNLVFPRSTFTQFRERPRT